MKKLLLVFAKSSITINIIQSDLNKHETQVLKLQMWMIPQIMHFFEESVLLLYLMIKQVKNPTDYHWRRTWAISTHKQKLH